MLRYVTRDLESQKDEEKADIFDKYGEILSKEEIDEKQKEWIEGFENWEYKITDAQAYKNYRKYLNTCHEEVGIDEKEWLKIQKNWQNEFYSCKEKLLERDKFKENLEGQNIGEVNTSRIIAVDGYNKARIAAGEIWHDTHQRSINISDHENYNLFLQHQETRNKAALEISADFAGHFRFLYKDNIKIDDLAADVLVASGAHTRKEAIELKQEYAEKHFNPIIDNLSKEERCIEPDLQKSINRSKFKLDKSDLQIWNEIERNKYKELDISKEKWNDLRTGWKEKSKESITEISDLDKEAINQFDIIKDYLSNKYHDVGLNDVEGQVLKSVKIYERTFKPKKPIKEHSFVYDTASKQYGFYTQNEYEEDYLLAWDKEGGIEEIGVFKEDLLNVGHSMKGAVLSKPKDFSHIVLSVGGDDPNPELALQATKSFLDENLGAKGFDYMYAMHEDSKNLHFHVILNNNAKALHKNKGESCLKFEVNKFDLQILREDYTKKLDELGIDRTATLKKDRQSYLDKAQQKIKNSKNFDRDWYSHQLSQSENTNFDALKFRRNAMKQLSDLSKKLELKGFSDMASEIRAEKEHYSKIEPSEIGQAITSTLNVFKKDETEFVKTMEKTFKKNMGKPKDYRKDNDIQEKLIESYAEHIEKTIEDLENVKAHELSSKLIMQRGKALNYLEDRSQELEQYREMDEGRCLEMER